MVINLATIDFASGASGGGGKPAVLQEKTATVVSNGSQTILPDEGFDGLSSVNINAAITGASSAIDFSIIGYSDELSAELNAKFNNDVAYSKTLYDAWNPENTSALSLYDEDTKLVFAPNIDLSNVTDTNYMFDACTHLTVVPLYNTASVTEMIGTFRYCSSLTTVPAFDTSKVTTLMNFCNGCTSLKTVPLFDTSNVTNMDSCFQNCSGLTSVPAFDTSKVTKINNCFNGCKSLTTVPEFNTSNAAILDSMFYNCASLTTINGISFKSFSASTMNQYYIVGYSANNSIRKAVFKDIGYNSNAKQFNTSYIKNWGVNSDEIPDARQSLIDSLITYSFDRTAAGYPTCTITLSTNTKALLTDDEKSQIIAKGYVIA